MSFDRGMSAFGECFAAVNTGGVCKMKKKKALLFPFEWSRDWVASRTWCPASSEEEGKLPIDFFAVKISLNAGMVVVKCKQRKRKIQTDEGSRTKKEEGHVRINPWFIEILNNKEILQTRVAFLIYAFFVVKKSKTLGYFSKIGCVLSFYTLDFMRVRVV